MKFMRNHWYDLGLIPVAAAAICLILGWSAMDTLQKLALINFIIIFLHQFEEYRFPGGEPAITNLASQASDAAPADRYPLNQNNAMVINVVAAYTLYLFPVLFPHVLWLGLTPVIFGMSQLIVHVLKTPHQIGNRIYSPEAIAVVFGHLPVGIYWLCFTISNGMLHWYDVVLGFVYLAVFIGGFMLKIGYGVLKKTDSPYFFPKEEFERGGYAERIRNCKKRGIQ
jgi:hypothetical protein